MSAGGPAAVGPTRVLRKGGNPTLSTPSPEVADQVTHGVVAVARLLGDVDQGTPLDEEGAEHLIAAMERVGRFEEESQAEGIIHDLAPDVGPFVSACRPLMIFIGADGSRERRRGAGWEGLESGQNALSKRSLPDGLVT